MHSNEETCRTARATLLVAAAMLAAAGCSRTLNEEHTIGTGDRRVTIETIATPMEQSAPGASGAGAAQAVEPSLTSLDRDNWESVRVSVPNAMPAHQPVYRADVYDNTTVERSRGRFPTFESATQLSNDKGEDAQTREALLAPFVAAGDILLWPARAAYKRPWFATRGGMQGFGQAQAGRYERYNRPGLYAPPEPVGTANFPMAHDQRTPATPSSSAYPSTPAPAAAKPAPAPAAPTKPAPSRAEQPVPAAPPAGPAAPSAPAPEAKPKAPEAPAAKPPEEGKPAKHIGASDPLGPKN